MSQQNKRKRKKKPVVSKSMRFFQWLQKWLFVGTLVFVVYVIFFMPAGDGKAPVDQDNTVTTQTQQNKDFNLYTYLNGVKSANGTLTFDCEFRLENGDNFKVSSSKKFETKGSTSSITGSTMYNLNENAAVFDDYTYLSEGYRYVKAPTGYVKTTFKPLDGGNLNLYKIESQLVKGEELLKEDGISCYKYTATMPYSSMSNELRDFVRSQNVNVGDVNNVMLDMTLFVTEGGVPYKCIVKFNIANCTIKADGLAAKKGTASGTLTIAFSGFNGVQSVNLPSEISAASEGKYAFTDKVNRYLSKTGQ